MRIKNTNIVSLVIAGILFVAVIMIPVSIQALDLSLVYPTDTKSVYGGFHGGVDFLGSKGDVIRAAMEGTVSRVRRGCISFNGMGITCKTKGCNPEGGYWLYKGIYYCNGAYGNVIEITGKDGIQTLYGHMTTITKNVGDKVYPGTPIGTMGSTGASTDPHLHFELTTSSGDIDPRPYFTDGSNPPPPDPDPDPPPGNVRVDYYNNINIQSGTPVYTEYIGSINRDWGDGGPGSGVLTDNFSARFTQQMSFSEGWYKFTYFADDGIKIWVDTVNVKNGDKWEGYAGNGEAGPIYLSGGTHTIWVDLRENSGGARINVSVAQTTKPDDPPPTDPNPPPPGEIRVDYYNSINIQSGAPVYTEYIESINRDWGNGGPGNGVLTDNFSARFTQQKSFSEGYYKFTYFADDGIKIWIDGVNKWDKWEGCENDGETGPIFISGGTHTLWVDLRENTGGAKITVNVVPTEPLAVPVTVTRVTASKASLTLGEAVEWNIITSGGSGALSYRFQIFKDGVVVDDSGFVSYSNLSYQPRESGAYTVRGFAKDSLNESSMEGPPLTVVNPTVLVSAIQLSHQALELQMSQAQNLGTTILPVNAGNMALTWSSSTPGVASVDQSGLVTGVAPGTAVITATAQDGSGMSASCAVTVLPIPELILNVVPDKESAIVGTTITWTAISTGGEGEKLYYFTVYRDDVEVANNYDFSPDNKFSFTLKVPGLYKALANVKDNSDQIGEYSVTTTIIEPLSDLLPTEITCDVGTIYAGDSVVLDSGVVNRGTMPAEGFNIKWYVNDVEEGYGYHEGVPAASTVMDDNSAFYWTPAEAGDYYVVFFVDCDNSIAEEDEDNNWTSKWFTVMEPEQTEPIDNGLSDVYFNAPQEPLAEGQAYEAFINLTGTDINALLINAKPTQGLTINELDVINSAWSMIIQTNDTYLLYGDPTETVEVRIEFTTNIINDGPHEEGIHFSGEASPKGLIDSVLTMSVQPDTGTILLKGDADADGSVNIMDLVAIIDYIILDTQCESMFNADVNADGTVDIMDLVWIIDVIVGR